MVKKSVKKTSKKNPRVLVVNAKHAKIVKVKKSVSSTEKLERKIIEKLIDKSEPVKADAPVYYQDMKIVRVLDSGHTKTHKKCEGLDRNGNLLTLHVPKELLL